MIRPQRFILMKPYLLYWTAIVLNTKLISMFPSNHLLSVNSYRNSNITASNLLHPVYYYRLYETSFNKQQVSEIKLKESKAIDGIKNHDKDTADAKCKIKNEELIIKEEVNDTDEEHRYICISFA